MHSIRNISWFASLAFPLAVSAAPQPLILDPGGTAGLPRIDVLSSQPDRLDLEFSLPALTVEHLEIEGRAFQALSIPGGGVIGEIGHPQIPTFTRLVAIPDRSGVTITSVIEEEVRLSGYTLAPVRGYDDQPFLCDAESYERDDFGAVTPATIGDPAILRDLRVVALTFQPVRYNPAQGLLKIADRIRVEITFEGENPENARSAPSRPITPSFRRLYEQLVVNYAQFEEDRGTAHGTWVAICPDNAGVVSAMQPLLAWRERKGYPIRLATTAETGTSASSIKSWIQAAYDAWNAPPEYIVLVGDATGSYIIPTWFENLSGYGGEGDHPYVRLDGDDPLADAHIGRLSFGTLAELGVIVDKIVSYESTPELSDPGWYMRACLVGDPDPSGLSCIQAVEWVEERLREHHDYTQIDMITDDPFVTQMSAALNQGDTIFGYRGYYNMSGWQNSNTYILQNNRKMPFCVILTCDTGSFAAGTARSEGFLRANYGGEPRGGIGAIGTATTGTHTRYNNCMHYGIFFGLLWENQYNLGAALTRGKLEMYLNYQDSEPNEVLIWSHWNNLMGDPAVECWTGFPDELEVDHPIAVPVGSNALTVTVESHGLPVEEAQVCLLKEGETHVVGFTDASGRVELPITAESIGDIALTVTKHNRHPYLATVPVVLEDTYIGYEAHLVDDDTSGTSSGNGNAETNPGETIELKVELRNYGLQTASGITSTLTCSDSYVTITDAQEDFGNLAGGETAWSADDFDLVIDPTCPHGRVLRLGLEVSSGEGQWHSLIELPVVSADLIAEDTIIHDAGNGLFEAGETIDFGVMLGNHGGEDATSVTGILRSLTDFVTVLDESGSWGTIASGFQIENTDNLFTIAASPETYEGHLAVFELITTFSGGLHDTTTAAVTVGQRTTDDPVGPDSYGYRAFDNTDASYPEAPAYEWIEIDPNYGGSGEEIPLTDFGSYQDDSVVIDLPFPFVYYGELFTRATICSNGWIAMGDTYLTQYRNWTIPAAGGPDGILAVFWDDLRLSETNRVYMYEDSANHRLIVEWSRLRNEPGATQTFEAILYDPEHHPTLSGDGVIVFQYHTINNNDHEDNCCTVGIESPDGFDGLLYSYSCNYAAGAAALASGRAICFLPSTQIQTGGAITGIVSNASCGNIPLPDAEITLEQIGRTFVSAADGSYDGSAPAGVYTITAVHPGFEPFTVWGVRINAGDQTELDFELIDNRGPFIRTTAHESTDDTVGPYSIPVTIIEPSGLEETILYYAVDGSNFTPLDLVLQDGEEYLAEIPGQEYGRMVQYYAYARDGLEQESIDPPAAPDELYSFLVTPTICLFADDMEANQDWTVGGPDDDATTGFWERTDPMGTEAQPEDDHTPIGVNCFVTDGRGGAQGDYDVDGGQTTLTSPLLDLTSFGTVRLRYYRWYTNDTGNNPGEDVWIAEVSDDDGADWTTIESTNISDRSWQLREYTLNDYIEISNSVRIRFIASDEGEGSVVEAAVDDLELVLTGLTVDSPETPIAPLRFSLMQIHPNPSRSAATITYSLKETGVARLAIYDVEGRLIRSLLDGRQPAGRRTFLWDGCDDFGRKLPSGIYFYRLDAIGGSLVRKLIRLQ